MNVRRCRMCLCLSLVAGSPLTTQIAAPAKTPQTVPATWNVIECGAKADGTTKDTQAVQKAIEACSAGGGGTVEQTNVSVPEEESKYPEATMFGVLPSYGLYCRHVDGGMEDIRLIGNDIPSGKRGPETNRE